MAARTAVVAGTATAVSGRVARRQANKYAGQDQQMIADDAAAAQAGAQSAVTSDADELQKLAELHTQGILTDEEFAAKKAQILGI